jgi:hypothetical protein
MQATENPRQLAHGAALWQLSMVQLGSCGHDVPAHRGHSVSSAALKASQMFYCSRTASMHHRGVVHLLYHSLGYPPTCLPACVLQAAGHQPGLWVAV